MMQKKIFLIVAALSLLVLCTACQSDEAKALDASIKAMGQITLDSDTLVEGLEDEYNNLSAEDQKSLRNLSLLTRARETLTILQITEKIDALPHAYLEIKGDLDVIQELYDTLPDKRKLEITNYSQYESILEDWYSEAYYEAESLYADSKFLEAYDYYTQLPTGYQESDKRIEELELLIEGAKKWTSVLGTWVWDGNYSDTADGESYAADFASLTITQDSYHSVYEKTVFLRTAAEIVDEDIVQSSLMYHLTGAHDYISSGMISNSDHEKGTWDEPMVIPDGDRLIASSLVYVRDYSYAYRLTVTYHFQEDGRLRLQYELTEINAALSEPKTTEVEFYYNQE